jgi:prepilin-type N-terminal cleavage/methylation domain-containing protein
MSTERAFTLLEVLIVLAITALMFMALITIFIRYNSYFVEQRARITVGQSAAVSMNELHRLSLQADAVVVSHAFGGTTYTSGPSTLVLELPSITSSGDIVDGAHDYVVFYASGTTLYRMFDIAGASARSGGTKALTTALEHIAFTYDNADLASARSITIDLATQVVAKSGAIAQRLTERMYLHNL